MNAPGFIKYSSKTLASTSGDPLRIAVLVDRFGKRFGGAESYCVNVVAAMAMHHEITVIAHEFEHDLPIREIRIDKSDLWPSWYRVWRFALKAQQLTRDGYDIVHSHVNGPTGHIHTVHVTPFKYRHIAGKTIGRQALAMLSPRNLAYVHLEGARLKSTAGQHVVTVSPATRDQLESAYSPDVDIEVLPPGVRPVALDPTLRRQTRATLGWSDDITGYLLVARNPLRKGLHALLQAMRHLPMDARLAVVGANEAARHFIDAHFPDLAERVSLVEPVSDVSRYYQAADIYVHPTLNDAFAMAPLEAMAHGLPVIVSSVRYCGLAQFLTHCRDAWILDDPKDSKSLAQAMLRLGNDDLLRRGIVRHASRIVDTFAWSKVAERYEQMYRESIRARSYSIPALPVASERIISTLSLG